MYNGSLLSVGMHIIVHIVSYSLKYALRDVWEKLIHLLEGTHTIRVTYGWTRKSERNSVVLKSHS